jgi:hypothetical protein
VPRSKNKNHRKDKQEIHMPIKVKDRSRMQRVEVRVLT